MPTLVLSPRHCILLLFPTYSKFKGTHKRCTSAFFPFYMNIHWNLPCSDSAAKQPSALVVILVIGKLRSCPNSSASCPSHPPLQSHLIPPFHHLFCGGVVCFFFSFLQADDWMEAGKNISFYDIGPLVKKRGFIFLSWPLSGAEYRNITSWSLIPGPEVSREYQTTRRNTVQRKIKPKSLVKGY